MLAERLIEIDPAEAERIEAIMVEVLDPIYVEASAADPMMRILLFCDDMRAITG